MNTSAHTGTNKTAQRAIMLIGTLNNIFNAMKGIRIFERFVFNLPTNKEEKPAGAFVAEKYKT